ncbi:MAG: ABC transporter substrate-binding protein [Tardiphaga sp.]
MNRREFLHSATAATIVGGFASLAPMARAQAQSKQETLLIVSEGGPNNLDVQGVGTNRPGYEVSWNCYDRLMTYATKTMPDGSTSYDQTKLAPELAETWEVDAKGATFHLRKDATFHDGTPVKAADVKYSFDRAVSVGGFPTSQMAAGSMLKPEQFTAIDDHTFRVDFVKPDALTLPDIAVLIPAVYNSALVKKNATEKDPWGMEFVKNNMAGGGAFKVEKYTPGTEVVYVRNDSWKCGPLPALKRVIWRMVPTAGNRRALVERGDADISFEVPAKDYAELKEKKFNVAANPISNGMFCIELNVTKPPFDNVKVRQAVAYAVPYQKIMDVVFYGAAKPLYGAASNKVDSTAWPCPTGYTTDLAKAKALLAEAGLADGFETVISLDIGQGTISEPIAVLMQENLAAIGVKARIDKIPGSNWRGEMTKKTMPFMINFFSGWLDYPEYFFFLTYHGSNPIFNTMSYQNPALDKEIDGARATAASGDKAGYETAVKKMIDIAWEDIPRIPLVQPYLNDAMQKNISGYTYWFHRQLDYRSIKKA